jgi:hypothetical protein
MNLLSDFPTDILIFIFKTFLLAVNLRELDSACCSSLIRGSFLKLLTNDGFVLQFVAHLDHYKTKYTSSKWLFLRSIKCSQLIFNDLDCFIFLPQIQIFQQLTTTVFHSVFSYRDENDLFVSIALFLNKCTILESFKISFCNGHIMQNIVLNLSKEFMAQIKSFELTTMNPEMNSLLMRHIGDYCHNLFSVKFWSKSSSPYKNNTTFSDDVIHVLRNCNSITSVTANLIKTQISDELFDTICLGGWRLEMLKLRFSHYRKGSVHSMVEFINSLSVNLKSMFLTAEKVNSYDPRENSIQYFRDCPVGSRLFVDGSFAGVCFWEVFQKLNCNSIFSKLLSMELSDITTQPSDTSLSTFIGNNKFLTELSIDDNLHGFGSFSGETLLTLVKGLKSLSHLRLERSTISAFDIVKICTVEGSNLKECFIKCCRALTFDAVETIFRTNKTLELFTVWGCPMVHKSDKVTLCQDTCSSYLEALNPTLKFKCCTYDGW